MTGIFQVEPGHLVIFTRLTSSQGGIRAVVWTDALQAVSMYLCVLLVMVMGVWQVGGLGVVWERGVASGRIEPPV